MSNTLAPLPAAARGNPFGTRTRAEDIEETLAFLDDWEARYRYVIDLGRELPELPDSERADERLVPGCQSRVWISARVCDGVLWFDADGDAHIVRGLIAIVLAALNGHPAAFVASYDIERYFAALDLMPHLSQSRGNGLRAMVTRIRELASRHASAQH